MSISYSWKITGIKTKTEGQNANAVVQVYWTKTGTNVAGKRGCFKGVTPFTSEGMNSSDFIAFEKLNEATIIEWVKARVVGDHETFVNAQIQNQIDSGATPTKDLDLPWNVSVKS